MKSDYEKNIMNTHAKITYSSLRHDWKNVGVNANILHKLTYRFLSVLGFVLTFSSLILFSVFIAILSSSFIGIIIGFILLFTIFIKTDYFPIFTLSEKYSSMLENKGIYLKNDSFINSLNNEINSKGYDWTQKATYEYNVTLSTEQQSQLKNLVDTFGSSLQVPLVYLGDINPYDILKGLKSVNAEHLTVHDDIPVDIEAPNSIGNRIIVKITKTTVSDEYWNTEYGRKLKPFRQVVEHGLYYEVNQVYKDDEEYLYKIPYGNNAVNDFVSTVNIELIPQD